MSTAFAFLVSVSVSLSLSRSVSCSLSFQSCGEECLLMSSPCWLRTTMNDRSSRSHTIFMFKVGFGHMKILVVTGLASRECRADKGTSRGRSPRRLKSEMPPMETTCQPCRPAMPIQPGAYNSLSLWGFRSLTWPAVRMSRHQNARATASESSGHVFHQNEVLVLSNCRHGAMQAHQP